MRREGMPVEAVWAAAVSRRSLLSAITRLEEADPADLSPKMAAWLDCPQITHG